MLEKSENYQKLYYSFLNFIRENLELNELVYKNNSSAPINYKVEKFMKENSITESILLGLIDQLSLIGFIKYEEQKNIHRNKQGLIFVFVCKKIQKPYPAFITREREREK